jgi:hypothetical protein
LVLIYRHLLARYSTAVDTFSKFVNFNAVQGWLYCITRIKCHRAALEWDQLIFFSLLTIDYS